MKALLSILSILVLSVNAHAGIALDLLDTKDVEDLVQDFGANFTHTTVSPASGLGRIFGFEVGLVVGASKTPGVNRITKEIDPTADEITALPHAALIGIVTFPLGITGEIGVLPKYSGDEAEIKSNSLAVKWTYSTLFTSPVDLSVKLHGASSSSEFVQNDPVPDTKVKIETKTTGLLFQVSKSFAIIEPYFGAGFVSVNGDLSATQDIFVDAPAGAMKQNVKITGNHLVLGANLNLFIFKLGLEVGRVMDNSMANLKASFYF